MKKLNKSSHCPNCGYALGVESNFCPECGQENDNKRQSFRRVMSELIQGFLSIDSRLGHSLPALLFRPGYLTKEYLDGRRQRYLDPVRMFITIVVIYFILSSFDSESTNDHKISNPSKSEIENTTGIKDTLVKIDNIQIQVGDDDVNKPNINIPDNLNDNLELDDVHYPQIKKLVKSGITDTNQILDTLKIEKTLWNRFYYGEIIKFAKSDFNHFKDFLFSKLPWIIFFLMPVFALLLKLLYLRRSFLYIDHLIFAFHLHSFLFISGIAHQLIFLISGESFAGWISLAVIVYILMAFLNFYKQSKRKTILKIITLSILYSISALFSFLLASVIIFLIY